MSIVISAWIFSFTIKFLNVIKYKKCTKKIYIWTPLRALTTSDSIGFSFSILIKDSPAPRSLQYRKVRWVSINIGIYWRHKFTLSYLASTQPNYKSWDSFLHNIYTIYEYICTVQAITNKTQSFFFLAFVQIYIF